MKTKIIPFIFAIVITIGLLISCSNKPYQTEVVQDDNRFQIIYDQYIDAEYVEYCGHIRIILDKETNVKYIFYKSGYGAGLTKLED